MLGACAHVALAGDNWPTWRGPDTMGISPGGNPPLEWSETKNIKWKIKLEGDASNSSPVIWGDKIYLVGRNGVSYVLKPSDKFEVLAVNTLDDKFDCSPAFVGDEMYLKGKQNLYCIAALN